MKKFVLLLFLLSTGSLLTYAQSHRGTFKPILSTSKAGQILTFTYNADGSDLIAEKPIHASLYEYIRYKWIKKEILLTQTGKEWKGSYPIPAGSAFIALKFYQGTEEAPELADNNNNKGYTIIPLASNGKKYPGAGIAYALLTAPRFNSGWLNYVTDFNNILPSDELQQMLTEESEIPGTDLKYYLNAYVKIMLYIKGEGYKEKLIQWVNSFLKRRDLDEQDLVETQRMIRFELAKPAMADSVSEIVRKKYPKGSFVRMETFGQILKANKPKKETIQLIEDFLNKFPYSEWLKKPNEQEYIYYETYRLLSSLYFDTRKFDSFLGLIPQLNFKTINEIYRWNIERAYVFKLVSKDSILKVAQPLIDALILKENDASMASNGFYSRERALENAHVELEARLMKHISLLVDLGMNNQALAYFNHYTDNTLLKDPDLNDTHLRILENLQKDKKEILSFIENCVSHDAVSPAMYEKLKAIYKADKGDLQKFDEYIAMLKSNTSKESLKLKIQKNMMNVPLPDFEIETKDGSLIHSSGFGNKIVVIDFWATWCLPCIRALPGMQIVVDKYSSDPDVSFYFVGTMQNGDYKQKTATFVSKEKFKLNFVFDCIDTETGEQNATFSKFAKILGSSGIPRKVVIKDGVLRYSTEGYGGSAIELSDELSTVINLLKSENRK